MAKKKGLGRGLDALFADAAPIYENDAAEADASEDRPEGAAGETVKHSAEKAAIIGPYFIAIIATKINVNENFRALVM